MSNTFCHNFTASVYYDFNWTICWSVLSLLQDFDQDHRLKNLTIEFLDDIMYSPNLLPAEHKAASQLLRLITKEDSESSKVDLSQLLIAPSVSILIPLRSHFELFSKTCKLRKWWGNRGGQYNFTIGSLLFYGIASVKLKLQ